MFDFTVTTPTKSDQIDQLVCVDIIPIKFLVGFNMMNSIVINLFPQLFMAYLTFVTITFNCLFTLVFPIKPAIMRHAATIKMAVSARFTYTVTYPFAFIRTVIMAELFFARQSLKCFSAYFADPNYFRYSFGFPKTFIGAKFELIVGSGAKLFAAISTNCGMSVIVSEAIVASQRTIFSVLRWFRGKRFTASNTNRGMLIHSNEPHFVAHSRSAYNTFGNLFAANYIADRGI